MLCLFILYISCEEAIKPDTTPPTVIITQPEDGTELISSISIKVEVIDDSDIERVEFFVDGKIIGRVSTIPYEQYWNVAYWADGNIHHILAGATDQSGNEGISDSIFVTVSKEAMVFPILISPANEAIFTDVEQVSLSWYLLPGAEKYAVEVSSDSGFSSVEFTEATFDTIVVTSTLSQGWYFWRVKAQNNQNLWTSWCTTRRFKIDGPNPPTFIFPIQDYVMRDTNIPTIMWNASEDAVIYEVQVSSDFEFSELDYSFTIDDTVISTSELMQGWHYTRIRAQNALELWGNWSDTIQFKIDGPLAPDLIYPEDGSIIIETQTPTLLWESPQYAISYYIEVSLEYDFTQLEYSTIISDTTTGTSDLSFGIKYWRVQAQNQVGLWGDWSQIFNFRIVNVFDKTFGGAGVDYGVAVSETLDGGFIVFAGTESFGYGGTDFWLIKTDARGNIEWSNTFGGDQYDYPKSGHQKSDGGYIIIGQTSSFGEGYYDVWLVKTDENGSEQWTQTFGGSGYDSGLDVKECVDGGYIIVGFTDSFGAGSNDVWLIKTDGNGFELWNRTFGGVSADVGHSVEETMDGGYIVMGRTMKEGDTYSDLLLIKTDSDGTEIWSRSYGGEGGDSGHYISKCLYGGYIITGHTESYAYGGSDIWLLKVNDYGEEEWSNTFGGNDTEYSYCVQETIDGGYIVIGFTYVEGSTDVWIIKTDSNGNEEWNRTYGGPSHDGGSFVQQTTDGGYIITGSTESFGNGGGDVWLIKTDSEGNTAPYGD